jgi:amidohydrolase
MTNANIDFPGEAQAISADLVDLRRRLHRIPELGNDLPNTQAMVLEALAGLPLEITTGESLSSIAAVLRGGLPGPTVLLRGDMDGLPVIEDTGLDFASTNGNMHACGHDLHTAGLVGAARLLAAHRDQLRGTVVFMFQPGEEGPGGALPMLEEGLLDVAGTPVDAAFGLHVQARLNTPGTFETRGNTMLASSNQLFVTFHGVAGHGSTPSTAIDPIAPLLEFGQALQTMITRRFSVFDPVVATVTNLRGGEATNTIPAEAFLGATVRTLSKENTERFGLLATDLANSIAAGHGCTAEVEWVNKYPPTVNDPACAQLALRTIERTFGAARAQNMSDPGMGSEDFSYVLERVPGAYLFYYITPADLDPATAATNHSPQARFDDGFLSDGAAALAALAWDYAAEATAG